MGQFEIICADALKWLAKQKKHSLENIVTGIPDLDELKLTQTNYLKFFEKSVDLIFQKLHPKSYALFMVTDRKYQKTWIDKAYHIQKIAEKHKIPLRWHKLILLRPVDSTHIQRPTYQHYLCFSKESGPGEATPDVIMCGKKIYKNASCPNGTQHAISFLKRYSHFDTIIDPFVGRGTTLIEAQKQGGFSGIGVDLDPKQCTIARKALGISRQRKPKKTRSRRKPKTRSRRKSKTRSR